MPQVPISSMQGVPTGGPSGPVMMQPQGHSAAPAYQQYSQGQLQHAPPTGTGQRLDGPLAYLEQTAASIGMPDRRL